MSDAPEVRFVGRLGNDPELKFTNGGKAVTNFSFVVEKRYKNRDDEWVGVPTWFRVGCWDELAENVAASLNKGDRVYVVGTLENRKYEDRDTGEDRFSLEISAVDVAPSLKYAQAVMERVEREKVERPDRRKKSSGGGSTTRRDEPAAEPDYGYSAEEPF